MSELSPEDVKEILRLVDESRFDEFELETPRFSIRFRRGEASDPASPGSDPGQSGVRGGSEEGQTPGQTLGHVSNGLVDVIAPMVGTFYRAPAPGAPPFVEPGSAVAADGQVCIIEVMKLMNSIVAGVAGTVEEVCRADGEAVEYGDVLFRIRTA